MEVFIDTPIDPVSDESRYRDPERWVPEFRPGVAEATFLSHLMRIIAGAGAAKWDQEELNGLFADTVFPQRACRLALVLYAPGHKRILVSRDASSGPVLFSSVLKRLLAHPRYQSLAGEDFRLQMDFVVEPPVPIDLREVGSGKTGERHFEVGVDGLMFRALDGKVHLFLPGDAFVRSIMGMGQLREYLARVYGKEVLEQTEFIRFRSQSFLMCGDRWHCLYRGYPLVGALSKAKLVRGVELAIAHIQRNQTQDGKFLYYYDAARDSRWDHEHPTRHPVKNPFYNILRHGGGGLTCIFYERYSKRHDTRANIRLAIDYLIGQTRYQEYDGREGAFIYSERKAKLGGSGIALYLAAEYQLLTGDADYRPWADKLAWHMLNQIMTSGEFFYYNIYLDKPVSEEENQHHFSFYYPGEAICGLAKYLHLIEPAARAPFFAKLHRALDFLLEVRPRVRANEYKEVPSDSWLMMGIMELWDFPEMRRQAYADFVFSDAEKMINHLYKVTDAPYPDYAGAFYYRYGDYPYADGARCEGLLGAYELAVKMADQEKARLLWRAMRLAAWALLHLINTEEAIYFANNPTIAQGGIRFKYTRQWFRIDTIQHVASFFAKMLPYWERMEGERAG